MLRPKVAGILGVSYCGSSLINYILGSLPGCFAVGEAHWIRPGTGLDGMPHELTCISHGRDCLVFTEAIIKSLRNSPEFYLVMRAVGGAETLIVADKNPRIYEELGVPDAFVIVYKHPCAQFASLIRHDSSTLDEILEVVCDHYEWGMNLAKSASFRASVSLEELAKAPEVVIRMLVGALHLQYDDAALRWWETDQCSFGANFAITHHHDTPKWPSGKSDEWDHRFKRKFAIDDRWKTELTQDQVALILNHPGVKTTWGRLAHFDQECI